MKIDIWHNKVMDFIESRLLKLTNWIWSKRHKPVQPPKIQRKKAITEPLPKQTNPRKKKEKWNAHL